MSLPAYGGESSPFIKWAAQKEKWLRVDEKVETAVELGEFIMDLEHYQTAWGKMVKGQAPEWRINTNRDVFGPIPSEEVDAMGKKLWKKGVKTLFYSPSTFGGDGKRAFDTTGFGGYSGISLAIGQYDEQKAANPGMVPVFKYTGFAKHGSGTTATTIPQFTLVRWVPRPVGLSAVPQQAANQGTATATAAPAKASGNEF